jgi:hypothetical protein
MLKLHVYNEGELFGSATSIADLAQFSFNGQDSEELTVYEAGAILERDWRWEIDPSSLELENGLGTRVRFKDGSALSVSAWADCCDGNGYCPQCWDGRTRFDREAA